MSETAQKVFGSAYYEARWIARSSLVQLTASGILPCSNYTAQLEMRPERVIPPRWNFVFYVEEYCEKALRPFSETAVMVNSSGAKAVVVHDAAGIQEVPILQAFEPALGEGSQHVVYARLPKEADGLKGCQIASADTLLNACHYKAFGPASLEACEAFAQKNGGESRFEMAPGGEIPWPLLT